MDSDDQTIAPIRRPPGSLRVVVTDALGRPVRADGLGRWLSSVAPGRTRGSVTVALVSDARVRALNRRYRGKDSATDVLSFPAGTGGRLSPPVGSYLGDIVIARGVARRQARAAGLRERDEHRILALHGLLHLLGYDHERDQGQMARLEKELRRKGGLAEGLTERGSGLRPRTVRT